MDDNDYKWDQFTISFYYPVALEKLYYSWATQSGLDSFFIDSATLSDLNAVERARDEFVQTGDSFHWKWRHAFELPGKILKAIKNSEMKFSFGAMEVDLRFRSVDGGSCFF